MTLLRIFDITAAVLALPLAVLWGALGLVMLTLATPGMFEWPIQGWVNFGILLAIVLLPLTATATLTLSSFSVIRLPWGVFRKFSGFASVAVMISAFGGVALLQLGATAEMNRLAAEQAARWPQ